jgi:mono/diheme cytochrome c family protein
MRPIWQLLTLCLAAYTTLGSAWADTAMPDLKDKARIAQGAEVFAATCTYCHGDEGSGGRAGPLKGRADLDADYVFNTITHGKRVGAFNMPPWGGSIDVPTRWALTAYILSLSAQ